jgi:hypothetical protein
MGYYDAIASSAFKMTRDGRMAFYPWGKFGKGYVAPTEAQYRKLRRFVTWFYIAILPLCILAGAAGHWLFLIPVLLVVVPVYWVFVRSLTRGLPRTDEKLTFRDAYENQARNQGLFRLWFLFLASLAFFAAGIAIVVTGGDPVSGTFVILFAGSCVALFGWMLRARRRLREQPAPYKAEAFD